MKKLDKLPTNPQIDVVEYDEIFKVLFTRNTYKYF